MFYNNVLDIYEEYDSFLLDMYGVLYNGHDLYDGILSLLRKLKECNKKIVILSNTTLISEIAEARYKKYGLLRGVHFDEFITSGEVFNKNINKNTENALTYHQMFSKNNEIFQGSSLKESTTIKSADIIYIGSVTIDNKLINLNNITDFDNIPISIDNLFDCDWNNINGLHVVKSTLEACLKYKKILFCVNPDIFSIETVDGVASPVLCPGGVAEYYEKMGGEVRYFGKPYESVFKYASQYTDGKVVMVGDTPWTDILGGNISEIETILTLTGVSESFISKMPPSFSMKDCMHKLFTEITDKMIHKNLRDYSVIPTHIVKSFAPTTTTEF